MNEKYTGWSKARRFEAAVKKVVHDGWTQVECCTEFGVSRSALNPKVVAYRAVHQERVEKLKLEQAQRAPSVGLSPLGLDERQRVPQTFQEFDDHYFAHWQCPDCETHHERKPFHDEIVDVLNDPSIHRAVVNIPPFHAKTTYATVKNTILRVIQNPNTRQLLISKSQTFSKTFLQSISELLTDHDLYLPDRDLIDDFGPFRPEGAQSIWNQNQIYVAGRHTPEKDPTIQVLGVGNQIYGRRADDATLDDIADVDNSRNPDNVLHTLEWLDKMVHNRVGKRGKVAYVGTRVNHGDVYSHLRTRPGWTVVTYPCILDDTEETVLWPEHFPYSQALLFRNDMTSADFQLVYQNVDIPGLHADFPPEIVEQCKDTSRQVGHYESHWRLVAGLDPAGGNKKSGYTAFTLRGIDLRTGKRYLIDQVAVKSMRAPQMRDQIFEWTERYPIYEWRVEGNGLQSQLVQYNEEIVRFLARKGIRVVPHHTHCVDTETQVLSQRGWVDGSDLSTADTIYTLNTTSGEGEWKPVLDVFRAPYAGEMVLFEGKNLSALVTPNHKWPSAWLGNDGHPRDIRMVETRDLKTNDVFILGAPLAGDEGFSDPSFAELCGWVVTEGWFRGISTVCIAQSRSANPVKCERIEKLLAELGGEWSTQSHVSRINGNESLMNVFHVRGELAERIRAALPDRQIPFALVASMSSAERERLIEGMLLGDGHGSHFFSTDAGLIAAFEFACALQGSPTYTCEHENGPLRTKQCWSVNRKQTLRAHVGRHTPESIEWEGEVWCPTTTNGTFLAKRHGKVYFTGNTNKWDADFGVASMSTQFRTEMVSIPWGNAQSAQVFQPYVDQLIAFPMGTPNDRVMSDWFADLGCREFLNRGHMPLFNERMKVPKRVRRRRHLVDFNAGSVSRVPLSEQRANARFGTRPGGGRQTVGRPGSWSDLEELEPGEPKRFVNVPGFVNP